MAFDPRTGEPLAAPPAPATGGVPQPPPGSITINTGVPVADPAAPTPPPNPASLTLTPELQRYFDEERERVRQEEKNKLYPELEQQRQALAVLEQEREQRIAAEALAEQERQAAIEAARTEELSARDLLLERDQQWQARFDQLQQQREADQALLEREREFSALNEFRGGLIGQMSDQIAPQFHDLIRGNTREEITASAQDMARRTAEIAAEVQEAQQGFRRTQPLPMTGAPPTTTDALGSQGQSDQVTFTAEQIRGMNMDEYAQIRDQLRGAASQQVRANGLYGG